MSQTADGMRKFVIGLNAALADACSDSEYAANSKKPVYQSFDPSFLFPPLVRRERLDINNPRDWFDIAAMRVFNELDKYDSSVTGYQFVMPWPTFLTIKRNYQTDADLLKSLSESRSDEDMYRIFYDNLPSSMRRGNNDPSDKRPSLPPSSEEVDQYLSRFLTASSKQHVRLARLRDLVRNKFILTERDVLTPEEIRRAAVTADEFHNLHAQIDKYRTLKEGNRAITDDESFARTVETYEILSHKRIAQVFNGRYVFMGWPKSRGAFSGPRKIHRYVLSTLYRFASLDESPNGDSKISRSNHILRDYRDQSEFYLRLLLDAQGSNLSASSVLHRGIELMRNNHLNFLLGGTLEMANEERSQIEVSFSGKKHEVRKALAGAYKKSQETAMTMEELDAELGLDVLVTESEELPSDHPIRQILDKIKPRP